MRQSLFLIAYNDNYRANNLLNKVEYSYIVHPYTAVVICNGGCHPLDQAVAVQIQHSKAPYHLEA